MAKKQRLQTYYLTRYLFTSGIKEVKGRVHDSSTDKETWIRVTSDFWMSHKLGRDIHTSLADARVAAEEMRAKKIASLEKQIEKLRNLHF